MHSPLTLQNLHQRHHRNVDKTAFHFLICSIMTLSLVPYVGLNYHNLFPPSDASVMQIAPKSNSNSYVNTVAAADTGSTRTSSTSTPQNDDHIGNDYPKVISILDDSLPIIHIVNSRFQQHAHNLSAIGAARLELFETFCLPSILHQTIQPQLKQHNNTGENATQITKYRFVWIIKVDPNLDLYLRTKLEHLLKPYPNFFLVGSNNNFGASYGTGIEPGSWRGGHAGNDALFGNATTNVSDLSQKVNGTQIYAGDVSMLRFAHAHRSDKIISETRVDADDGLPAHYLEAIQTSAIKHLSKDPNEKYDWPQPYSGDGDDDKETQQQQSVEELTGRARWLYWCIPRSISWHPAVLENGFDPSITLETNDPGRLALDTNKGNIICMTPGLTSGMSVGIDDSDMPRYSHYALLNQLKRYYKNPRNNCGVHKLSLPCLQVLDEEAVRSRTPTSAGMQNVRVNKLKYTQNEIDSQWQYMLDTFGVQRNRAAAANLHIQTNLVAISLDNLNGQCTHGHSCKDKARLQLLSMIEAAQARDDIKLKAAAELLQTG